MFSVLACGPLMLLAQQLRLTQQVLPEEITKRTSNSILEDRYGFIWLAGGNQLYKYDGFQSRGYVPAEESVGGPEFGCRVLLEDQEGNIWVGASSGLYRYDRKTDQLTKCFPDKIISESGDALNIFALHQDPSDNIWVGGENRLFIIKDQQGQDIQLVEGLSGKSYEQIRGGIRSLATDLNGRMYVGASSGFWHVGEDYSLTLHLPEQVSGDFFVNDLAKGNADTMWLATTAGLWSFVTTQEQFSQIDLPADADPAVRKVLPDKEGRIWIGKSDGVWVRGRDGGYEAFTDPPFHFPRSLLLDRFGNLWVGNGTGAHRLPYEWNQKFPVYKIESYSRYQDNYFHYTAQDSVGGFWFRLLRTGLGYAATLNAELEVRLQPPNHLFIEEIKSFCTDPDGHVWVATLTNGLYQFENGQARYRHLPLARALADAEPLIILSDHQDGNLLWVSTKQGLCAVDRFTYQTKWYYPSHDLPWLGTNALSYIEQAADGNIWAAVRTGDQRTVVCFDREEERFTSGLRLPLAMKRESGNSMRRVADDLIWLGEDTGLSIIDTRAKTASFITGKEGLPTPGVGSVVADQQGNIWYASGQRVCRYDGSDFTCYHTGMGIDHFVVHSSTLTREGKVAFGASNGLMVFDPRKMVKDTIHPKVVLSSFQVFNEERALETALELVQEITLPYEDNILSFTFSALHFTQPDLIRFRHQLEGFDHDWVETTASARQVTYTNLAPGAYTFKVIARNVDGLWTSAREQLALRLIILPPWYRSWWAYLLWTSLVLGSIYVLYRFQLNRQLALAEAQTLKELDHAKSRLYGNITHEFRTPLTIILGMIEQMKKDPENWFNEGVRLIRRNGKQLLNLVNQLLDLSKLESGHMPLRLVNGDMVSFLNYFVESFHSYADSKDIRIHFITEQAELWTDYDPEKLRNVVSNLISNAIKFTPAGGNVYVDIRLERSQNVRIQIRDDGIGIPPEHLPFIFDRFYQVDSNSTRRGEGTGIGLALAKELVHNMQGTIEAKSDGGKGTQITIFLPFVQLAEKRQIDSSSALTPVLAESVYVAKETSSALDDIVHADRFLILLVEDNADVLKYLSALLANDYQIVTAENGQEGIDKALDIIPDLIVSDVMMPEKDGYELCAVLKEDQRTNHIPIILLTAKSDQSAKLQGLTEGADAYLAKPFHEQELLVRIEKLISLRQRMQQMYQKGGDLYQRLKKIPQSREEEFLQKTLEIIERNLNDENFGMPQLCRSLHMSRSHVFRKLKAVTGKSATHLIRQMRLEKAMELLRTTHLSVSEVCFEVGFNNPGYFSRVFQQEFGMSPREAKKR